MPIERRLSIPGPAEYRAAMVLAFLAGRKTQVRLPIDPPPSSPLWETLISGLWSDMGRCPRTEWRCPFGAPWDVLWIPETWGVSPLRSSSEPALPGDKIIYFASDDLLPLNKQFIGDRRPWNHMPRRACRLTRRVADVRIEQVQEITTDGVKAEGHCWPHDELIPAFRRFWDARYAGTPFAWSENPPVWVATLEPEGA